MPADQRRHASGVGVGVGVGEGKTVPRGVRDVTTLRWPLMVMSAGPERSQDPHPELLTRLTCMRFAPRPSLAPVVGGMKFPRE